MYFQPELQVCISLVHKELVEIIKGLATQLDAMAHACNPSHLGG
jgi:hypothetical protein